MVYLNVVVVVVVVAVTSFTIYDCKVVVLLIDES